MASLPVEVLSLIFAQLVQRDQLECMTVCRQWRDIIHEYTLFRFIYIDHKKQLDQLIERVKKNPVLGTKVEQLTLEMEFKSTYNPVKVIKLFPNLLDFATLNSLRPRVLFQGQPWCERIESIVELGSILTHSLLSTGLCRNLTYLTMSGSIKETGRHVIKALVNAPALKMLDLAAYTLSYQDFEFLHEALPVLETLLLNAIQLDDSPLPRHIKPAVLMKVLQPSWIYMYNSNQPNQYFTYISQKYTHLEKLELNLVENDSTVNNRNLDFEDEDNRENENSNPIETQVQFKARLTSYIKTLAPHLKDLTLNVSSSKNDNSVPFDFNILDKCECQMRALTLQSVVNMSVLENLATTTQAQKLQSLTLVNSEYIDKAAIPLKWLKHFTALKELNIESSTMFGFSERTIMDPTKLVENLREHRLETLVLCNVDLEFKDSSIIHTHPSLKKLVLSSKTFPEGTDIFLSRAFPNLKHLELELDHRFSKRQVFNLPNLDLSYLKVVNRNATGDFSIMLNTLDNNQRRLYCTITKSFLRDYIANLKKEAFPRPYVSSKAFDKSDTVPMITIICKSVFDVVIRSCKDR